MGLADCEKCWDPVCSCGWQGYVAVYATNVTDLARLRRLTPERMADIVALLTETLSSVLAREPETKEKG